MSSIITVRPLKYFQFKALRQIEGWLAPAYIGVDSEGKLQYLSTEPPDDVSIEYVDGFALPGFQNAHSHAFQYAMAGMAETHEPGATDDFWSWREAMYLCALSMDPGQVGVIATMLYAEMLKKGYTHVAEFHYLHHDKDGNQYNNIAEIGERLVEAASLAGIRLTLIPIFYQKGGFGIDYHTRQRRFISKNTDAYFKLLTESTQATRNYAFAQLGFGVHSLRAVDPADIIKTFTEGPKDLPFHLHAAEQLKEVEDCIAFLKQRPVQWLVRNMPISDRFNIVHCTHLNDEEVEELGRNKANVVLCPGTEGNLGDGIFRLTDFIGAQGSWSIGTDSHISLNPLEDLRWLDYAQRFTTHKRNTFDNGATILLNKTVLAGRKAMGVNSTNFFEIGKPFDAVVFSGSSPLLQRNLSYVLPSIVYTADSSAITGTIVNGKWVVKNQQHINQESIQKRYQEVMNSLVL